MRNMKHGEFLAIGLTATALVCSLALVPQFPRVLVLVLLFLLGVSVSWVGAAHLKNLQTLNLQGRVLSGLSILYEAKTRPELVYQLQRLLQRLFPGASFQFFPTLVQRDEMPLAGDQAKRWAQEGLEAGQVLIYGLDKTGPKLPAGVESLVVWPLPGPEKQAFLLINAVKSYGARNLQVVLETLAKHVSEVLDRLQEQDLKREQAVELLQLSLRVLESHQAEPCGHSQRVADISRQLGKALRMDQEELMVLEYAALLHDIGKWVPAPDTGGDKVHQVDETDQADEADHATIGADLIPKGESYTKIREAIRYHHERYDGQGYPQGLKHTEIPLAARIIAVANRYDKLTRLLPEEERCSPQAALKAIKRDMGTSFDPLAVVALEEIISDLSPFDQG